MFSMSGISYFAFINLRSIDFSELDQKSCMLYFAIVLQCNRKSLFEVRAFAYAKKFLNYSNQLTDQNVRPQGYRKS